jgi:hypothetical protein
MENNVSNQISTGGLQRMTDSDWAIVGTDVFIGPRDGYDFPVQLGTITGLTKTRVIVTRSDGRTARFSRRSLRQHPFLYGHIVAPRTDERLSMLWRTQHNGDAEGDDARG